MYNGSNQNSLHMRTYIKTYSILESIAKYIAYQNPNQNLL